MKPLETVTIVGAGPAGLACAYALKDKSTKVNIYEKEQKVGGISKTIEVNGYYYDLGGHRFFTTIDQVKELWEKSLGDDLLKRKRLSRIFYNNTFYDYPLNLVNLFQKISLKDALIIFLSYSKAKLRPIRKEHSFEDWIINRFGKKLYLDFFKAYTEKVWGIPCSQISARWASQRINGMSLYKTIKQMITKKNSPKTLITQFLYPKYGPGMMYDKWANQISSISSNSIHLQTECTEFDYIENRWIIKIKDHESNKKYEIESDLLVNSMPLPLFLQKYKKTPTHIRNLSSQLHFRSLIVVCLVFNEPNLLRDTWIYIHDPSYSLGRVQVMNNWSPYMSADNNKGSYGCEFFCTKDDSLWKTSDQELITKAIHELKESGLIQEKNTCVQGHVERIPNTYPIYDENYINSFSIIKEYVKTIDQFHTIGRGGLFQYNNMDHSIHTGLLSAEDIIQGTKHDLWNNTN